MSGLELPPNVKRFLEQPNRAVMACIRPDGYPMTVVTWYLFEGGHLLVNMDKVRRRYAWLQSNPRMSLSVQDEDRRRHVSLYGRVIELLDDSDLRDIDRIAMHYTGKRYPARASQRVSAVIEPVGWLGWDPQGVLAGSGSLKRRVDAGDQTISNDG